MGHEKRLVGIRKREGGVYNLLEIQRRKRERYLFVTVFKMENKNHKPLNIFEETEL